MKRGKDLSLFSYCLFVNMNLVSIGCQLGVYCHCIQVVFDEEKYNIDSHSIVGTTIDFHVTCHSILDTFLHADHQIVYEWYLVCTAYECVPPKDPKLHVLHPRTLHMRNRHIFLIPGSDSKRLHAKLFLPMHSPEQPGTPKLPVYSASPCQSHHKCHKKFKTPPEKNRETSLSV